MFFISEDLLDFLSEFDEILIVKESKRGFTGFGEGAHLNEKINYK